MSAPSFTALTLATLIATGCGSPAATPDATAPPPLRVATTRATAIDRPERLEAGGIVIARESATLAARIMAAVTAVHVRAGDRVRAGDVLVTLDPGDLIARKQAAVAAVDAAEQALVQARHEETAAAADHQLALAWQARIATLRSHNAATAQELDEADARSTGTAARAAAAAAAIDQASAHLAAARATADAASTTASFSTLRAPFAGVVTERMVDPGALAAPGMPLLRLDAQAAYQLDVRVDEARLAYVTPGAHVTVALTAGSAGGEVEGTVAEVARAVTPDQRTFDVKISLPSNLQLRSGEFARVRFAGEPRRRVIVPAGAIRRQGQVTSVFIVDGDIARIRLVAPGLEESGAVEVVSGLNAGEVVVVNPPAALVDGHRVVQASEGATP